MASNSPAYDCAQLLITANILTDGGVWPAKLGRLTPTPDAQVAIVDAPGQAPNPRWLVDWPSLQVLVRGKPDEYINAQAKAKNIKDALLGMNPVDMTTGDRWDGVTMLGDLAFLMYDANSRPIFTLNFRVILEPAANDLTSRESL